MLLRKRLLFILPPLAALLFAELMLPGGVVRRLFGTGSDDPGVQVIEDRRDGAIRLFVTTSNCLDITITVSAQLQNMRATPATPLTVETNGRQRLDLVSFVPITPGQTTDWRYTYHWTYGGRGGQPDGTVYVLPFEARIRHKLFQGYQGSFSHQPSSPNEYAHDWDLADGSIVCAARGGAVIGVRQDSNSGGVGERYRGSANYVIIRHNDGTYAEYLHLKQNGVRVRLGDTVEAGQAIALSGRTGYTSRPHLHFAVFRSIDGNQRETLPVKFKTKDGNVQFLEQGKIY